jgi:alpha-glucosidase (family GH31 glycosyl hydrolase)
MPYLVKTAEVSVRTGVPMLRHMALEFPGEPNAYTLDDQYALGSNLLVAPIIVEGARSREVYFPRGRWKALEHPATVFTGPGFHEVAASLDYIPVFVREGGEVPMLNEDVQNLKNTAIVKRSGPWQLAMHHSARPKDSRQSGGSTSGQPRQVLPH